MVFVNLRSVTETTWFLSICDGNHVVFVNLISVTETTWFLSICDGSHVELGRRRERGARDEGPARYKREITSEDRAERGVRGASGEKLAMGKRRRASYRQRVPDER